MGNCPRMSKLLNYTSTDERIINGYPIELEYPIDNFQSVKRLFYFGEETVCEAVSSLTDPSVLEVHTETEITHWFNQLNEYQLSQVRSALRSDDKMPLHVRQAIIARNMYVSDVRFSSLT